MGISTLFPSGIMFKASSSEQCFLQNLVQSLMQGLVWSDSIAGWWQQSEQNI